MPENAFRFMRRACEVPLYISVWRWFFSRILSQANADAQSVLRAYTFKANTSTEVRGLFNELHCRETIGGGDYSYVDWVACDAVVAILDRNCIDPIPKWESISKSQIYDHWNFCICAVTSCIAWLSESPAQDVVNFKRGPHLFVVILFQSFVSILKGFDWSGFGL